MTAGSYQNKLSKREGHVRDIVTHHSDQTLNSQNSIILHFAGQKEYINRHTVFK